MRTRIGLTVAAVLLLALGVACFWLISTTTLSSSDFDPVTGEPRSNPLRTVVTAVAPVVGVASVGLSLACGAGVVASLVVSEALGHAARLRRTDVPRDPGMALSAPETLEG